jgi:hypothetical protein
MLKNKKLLIASLIGATVLLSGCNANDYKPYEEPQEIEVIELPVQLTSEPEETYQEIKQEDEVVEEEPEVDEDTLDFNTTEIATIIDNTKTPIMDNAEDGNIIGYFVPGREFRLIDDSLEEYNVIDYYGTVGYVLKQDTALDSDRVFNYPMIGKGMVVEDAPLYDNYDLTGEPVMLSTLEFCEIYKELDNCYLVKTIDYVGFVPKINVDLLEGNIAVIDRSNQELRLYEGNTMTICTPVVTGTKDTDRESDLGLFAVRLQAENLYIVPGSWVDCVTYYNGGEGIHTAEWRTTPEFGGDTYLTNGSHGCINTPHDEAIYVHNTLTLGDKVLVKE